MHGETLAKVSNVRALVWREKGQDAANDLTLKGLDLLGVGCLFWPWAFIETVEHQTGQRDVAPREYFHGHQGMIDGAQSRARGMSRAGESPASVRTVGATSTNTGRSKRRRAFTLLPYA